MQEISKDLASITTIPLASINKILSRYQDCICYNLQQELNNITEYVELDIYIGKLLIKLLDNKIYYKFIPSSSFEEDVKETINNNESPLVSKLEKLVTEKITNAYKEFF